MRRMTRRAVATLAIGGLLGAGGVLVAQTAMKPGHERVPPFREPSPYMSATEIQAALAKLDPKLVASRTGGSIPFAPGKAPGVVRRRVTGPQYAITHTRTLEYVIVTKGRGTMVTGGTLIPPTIDSDPYPNSNPDAIIRSQIGVKDGLARQIGPGDIIVNLPGTPHWLSQIDDAIEYVRSRCKASILRLASSAPSCCAVKGVNFAPLHPTRGSPLIKGDRRPIAASWHRPTLGCVQALGVTSLSPVSR